MPTEAQRRFAVARWAPRLPRSATLATHVLPEGADDAALRAAAARVAPGAALVLDYVGHSGAVAERLRELLPAGTAVLDVGGAALATLQALLRAQSGELDM